MMAVLDAGRLGEAQIGALADHLRLHLVGIDAQGVIGLVADFPVLFVRCLHIGADAAKPEQFDLGLQQRIHQLGRADRVLGETCQGLDFRAERDRFGAAGENPAAF